MARGRKRIWVGGALLTVASVLAGAVIASRWYGLGWWRGRADVSGVIRYDWISLRSGRIVACSRSDIMNWFMLNGPEAQSWHWKNQWPDGWVGQQITNGPSAAMEMERRGYSVRGLRRFAWVFSDRSVTAGLWIVAWPIPFCIAAVGGFTLHRGLRIRRRHSAGKCRNCGYDLNATPQGKPCPECGMRDSKLATERQAN
ncbi:MAG: hypothetical protein HEQ23_10320 [Tepidisphaera sp.]